MAFKNAVVAGGVRDILVSKLFSVHVYSEDSCRVKYFLDTVL